MKRPFSLAGDHPSSDTIEVLRDLLQMAEHGQVIGIACVAMLKRRQLQTIATGEASRSPIFALGATKVLEQSIINHIAANE